MAIKCGVDIVEISRIKDAIENERFIKRVFDEIEINYCENKRNSKAMSYAARFAAKEAVVKALGTGFRNGIKLSDIVVCTDENNKPYVKLKGNALKQFEVLKGNNIEISLSHSKEYAVAFVIIEHN